MSDYKNNLKNKAELLQGVLALTRKQPSLMVSDDSLDALLENIQKRQILIDQLEILQNKSFPNKQSDKEYEALELEEKNIVEEIAKQDKLNEGTALTRMEELRDMISKNKNAKTTINAYEHNGSGQGMSFNRVK